MWRSVVLACLMLVAPLSNASAQLGFNLYRSGVEVSGEDLELAKQSVRTVMASGTVGTRDAWSNPETGMSGETTLLELYDDAGTSCGRVLIVVRRHDRQAPFDLRLCQRPDGTWGIAG